MADTAVLNAEPARPEEREKAKLPPKSFADAVEQGPTVDETVDAKSSNALQSENETNGTQIGLKEEEVAKDEPIATEGITNGKVNDAGNENVQKVEKGDKSEDITPETDGSDEDSKSFAEAVYQSQSSLPGFLSNPFSRPSNLQQLESSPSRERKLCRKKSQRQMIRTNEAAAHPTASLCQQHPAQYHSDLDMPTNLKTPSSRIPTSSRTSAIKPMANDWSRSAHHALQSPR